MQLILGILLFAMMLASPAGAQLVGPNGGSSGGGGGTTITSGAGAFAAGTSQSGAVLTGVLAAPYNTAYGAPTCGSGGTIANGGTVTPDFAATNCYTFTVASGASFTQANPTNLPTGAFVVISFNQAGTGVPTITWGNKYFEYTVAANAYAAATGGFKFYAAATTGTVTEVWWSDGTNLSLVPGINLQPQFNTVRTQGSSTFGGVTSTGAVALTGGSLFSVTGGTAPTLTAGCNGAGSAVAAGSTDNRGKITTQTAASTTCTLTFNHAWPQAPFCVASDAEATITPAAYSVGATGTGTVVFDFVSAANDVFDYVCM